MNTPLDFAWYTQVRRHDYWLSRLTDEELTREVRYWRKRADHAEEEAPEGAEDLWPMVCACFLGLAESEQAQRRRRPAPPAPSDGARLPESVVADIKRRLDLGELVERWGLTSLRKSGRALVGRCPFHDERSASFHVYTRDEDDQHYHCFGCGAHGDALDLARAHGPWLSFREAAEGLAALAGVSLPVAAAAPKKGSRSGGIVVRRPAVRR
ncbi:MAG TPA: CHC2 zinc finger domain-containing protein [Gemmatimonadaceae bacterium]